MPELSYLDLNGESLEIADEAARKNVDEAQEILANHLEKTKPRTFSTVDEMKAWLSDEANIGVASIGDHLYITDDAAPDWWIESVRGNPNPEGFYYDIKIIGADALVVMHEYVSVADRIKGSLYLQLGKVRGLIVKIFKRFFVSGKNLWPHGDYSGTQYGSFTLALEPGTYTVSALITTDDTDSTVNVMTCTYENGDYEYVYLLRGTGRVSKAFSLTDRIKTVAIYASNSWNNSSGDAFAWSDIQIELGDTATEYEPYYEFTRDESTLIFKEATEKTTNVNDGNKYRFTCSNLSILQDGDDPERVEGKIYFVAD